MKVSSALTNRVYGDTLAPSIKKYVVPKEIQSSLLISMSHLVHNLALHKYNSRTIMKNCGNRGGLV